MNIKILLQVYKNTFISKIIKQYLKFAQIAFGVNYLSPETVSILNEKIHPSWVLPMIGCNILSNP